MQNAQNFASLLLREGTMRRPGRLRLVGLAGDFGLLRRRPAVAIKRRTRHPERTAGARDRHVGLDQFFDRVHQSSSLVPIAKRAETFFWTSMINSACSSFFCSLAFVLRSLSISAALRSLGL